MTEQLENGSGRQSSFKALSRPPRIERVLSSRLTGYALLSLVAISLGGDVLSQINPITQLSPRAIEYKTDRANLDRIKSKEDYINDKVNRGRISELVIEAEKLEAKIENTPPHIIAEKGTNGINILLHITGKIATYLSLLSAGVIFGSKFLYKEYKSPSTSSTDIK